MSGLQARFEAKFTEEPNTGCWLWHAARNNHGYGKMWDGEKVDMAHRLSYRLYRGGIPDETLVLHSCDNPACVNPDHLRLGTYKDNTQDMLSRKRHVPPKGKMNSALGEELVAFIRNLHGPFQFGSIAKLAKQLGVSYGGFYKLRAGLRWKEC